MTTGSLDRAARKAAEREQRFSQARLTLQPVDDELLARHGLTAEHVQERHRLGLTNMQNTDSSRSFASILRANLLTLFNAVVGGSFLFLLVLGQWKDALFGFAVIANVLIGVIQEYRSKRMLDRLSLMNQPMARVRRDGEIVEISIQDVVQDDLLELRSSDQVPADGVVLESSLLEVDESLLTGEADPQDKNVGDIVLGGSGVVAGSARVRATRVGPETYASRITLEARRFSLVSSELRESLNKIVRWITWALVPIMAIVVNGQMAAVGGWQFAFSSGAWLPALVTSIASIISMIPQGLVLVTSVSFALAAIALSRKQVLVQELAAVEVLARVDIICFDKTGTLTEGDIVFDESHVVALEGTRTTHDYFDWMNVLSHFGSDPDANATTRGLRSAFDTEHDLTPVASVPFSSATKWSAFTLSSAVAAGASETWVLGAPERVLLEETPAQLSTLEKARSLAATGRRTLVLAVTSDPPAQATPATQATQLPPHLTPIVLVTFRERVRSDAETTLSYFYDQGVQVRIISGDSPITVAAVSRQAGVIFEGDGYDSTNLPTNSRDLADVMENTHVFGRVTPDQKRDMVTALQSRGHVVAMLGDGVNDALALKRADLGIAMGSGAAATKAVSNLVLLDGNFSHLPAVVGEGRRVIANVERVSRLFLTKTSWAITLALVFGILLWTFPFLPRQLSAVDGYAIGLPSVALAFLPNARRYLPGFLHRSLLYCIPSGVIIGAAVVTMNVIIRNGSAWTPSDSQTATSFLLSITGMWILTTLARPFDRWRLLIVAVMFVLFCGMFLLPLARDFFGFTVLSWPQLALPLYIGAAACAGIEIVNYVVSRATTRKIYDTVTS
jgi:cation-transporting ATPase E